MKKKVLVAGFFDLFHVGHVEFLKMANTYGDVYVSIGTDLNSQINKHKTPIYSELERKFIVDSCKYVTESDISYNRTDKLSFLPYLEKIKPDVFVTNLDGHSDEKQKLCSEHNIEYVVLSREIKNLPMRSSSEIRSIDRIPLRLDFVGFYDQLYLNKVFPGSVVLANIETINVEDRSGMSSSTRNTIRKIFGNQLPSSLDSISLAKLIFSLENPHGSKYISGVVDQLGICLKGINKLNFDNDYWPHKIESIEREDNIKYINKYLYIVQTKPRPLDFKLFTGNENFSIDLVKKQSHLGLMCWESIQEMDIKKFANCINQTHENQKSMIPNYSSEYSEKIIHEYRKKHMALKLMGTGGYGYLLVVTDNPESHFIKVNITLP